MSVNRPVPLTPAQAHEAIHRLLEIRDTIGLTGHVRQRMRQRQFTMDDIRRVLDRGVVSANPVWKSEFNNWVYTVSGRDYDNEPLAIVVALEPAINRLTVITGKDV